MRQHCLDSPERVKLLLLKIALLPQSVSRATLGCAARQTASGQGPAARGGGLRRRGRGRGLTWSLRWGREAGACLGPRPFCRRPGPWAGRQGRAGQGQAELCASLLRRTSRRSLTALNTCPRKPAASVRCSCPTGATVCRQRCSQMALSLAWQGEVSKPHRIPQKMQWRGEAPNIVCIQDCGHHPMKYECVRACNFFLKGYH